jgi:hypothetical protein
MNIDETGRNNLPPCVDGLLACELCVRDGYDSTSTDTDISNAIKFGFGVDNSTLSDH